MIGPSIRAYGGELAIVVVGPDLAALALSQALMRHETDRVTLQDVHFQITHDLIVHFAHVMPVAYLLGHGPIGFVVVIRDDDMSMHCAPAPVRVDAREIGRGGGQAGGQLSGCEQGSLHVTGTVFVKLAGTPALYQSNAGIFVATLILQARPLSVRCPARPVVSPGTAGHGQSRRPLTPVWKITDDNILRNREDAAGTLHSHN